MKKLLVTLFVFFALVAMQPPKCVVNQKKVDPYTVLVLVDLGCDGTPDAVETWKWNGQQWVMVFVKPYQQR